MVGYVLENTMSKSGSVSRGICKVNNGMLVTMEENTKIENLYNITGTPTVIFIEKGEEPSISRRIIGARDEDFIITKLGIAGYIKENK